MLKRMVFVGVMLSLLGPSTAYAANASSNEPDQVKMAVKGISVNLKASGGAGCPKDSVTVVNQLDGRSFFAMYKSLVAQGGGNLNCQLTLNAHAPDHVMYAIKLMTNEGGAWIGRGAAARHTVTSYFSGKTDTTYAHHDVRGPYYNRWTTNDRIQNDQLDWSPCGGDSVLIIKNYLQLNGGASDFVKVSASLFQLEARAC